MPEPPGNQSAGGWIQSHLSMVTGPFVLPNRPAPAPHASAAARVAGPASPPFHARRLPPAALGALACAWLVLALVAPPAAAQSGNDAERRLERVRAELKEVGAERRRLEGERGEANRDLRAADEQVGKGARALRETDADIARQAARLAELTARRDALRVDMAARRAELAALLRAAYTVDDAVPLKRALAQDGVAEASRDLAYHGYLQRGRRARIDALTTELAELDVLEAEVKARADTLAAERAKRVSQVATLERDRRDRAKAVDAIDAQYRDRSSREKALGRDAKSLERVLAKLRAAAAKAERERRAAEAAAAKRAAAQAKSGGKAPPAPAKQVARTGPAVGGLGWPLSGTLLAGFGAKMPDGRPSSGVLIGAATGTTVKAVADGSVVFAEWMTGYGLILIVDHGDGTMSLYAHNDALLKDPGDRVKRGDAVASVGNSGGQGQPALYFELRRDGKPVNPQGWLQKR